MNALIQSQDTCSPVQLPSRRWCHIARSDWLLQLSVSIHVPGLGACSFNTEGATDFIKPAVKALQTLTVNHCCNLVQQWIRELKVTRPTLVNVYSFQQIVAKNRSSTRAGMPKHTVIIFSNRILKWPAVSLFLGTCHVNSHCPDSEKSQDALFMRWNVDSERKSQQDSTFIIVNFVL